MSASVIDFDFFLSRNALKEALKSTNRGIANLMRLRNEKNSILVRLERDGNIPEARRARAKLEEIDAQIKEARAIIRECESFLVNIPVNNR